MAVQQFELAIDVGAVLAAAPLGWLAHRSASRLADGQVSAVSAPAAAAVAMAMAASAVALGAAQPLGVVLGWALLVLAIVDAATLRLPDIVDLPLIAVGLAASAAGWIGAAQPFWPRLLDHLAGAGLGYAALAGLAMLYRRARGRSGLGMGDAKLTAAGGAWLGAAALPSMVLIGCAVAFGWVAIRWLRSGQTSLQRPLPFGPGLAAGVWIAWVFASR
jgi:leader peptidase (prepilin peptidase)/N-methyltransferase